MNTIANWSDEEIYLKRRTPYVVAVGFGGKLLEGSEGYWGKFKDVFDPSFKEEARKNLARQKGKTAGDPWCIGYFVDNEASWGEEVSLSLAALMSPAGQAAKQAFISDLKAKYATVDKINLAWGASYESWDALLESRQPPDRKRAHDDLAAFYTKTAETYFKTIGEAVKEIAPNNLYLGCRFAWVNPLAAKAAGKYCDVISYNLYVREIENFRLPDGMDGPVIVGEFHFGALDRGMFHTGLQETENQAERAAAYRRYVSGALRNPLIIGTHWFQYSDQPTTGRGDGENYQIGFLDIVDTPYLETIEASRSVGNRMYEIRSAESSKSPIFFRVLRPY
jgi:beta-galactosidase GanA